jgi:hypothetical protein
LAEGLAEESIVKGADMAQSISVRSFQTKQPTRADNPSSFTAICLFVALGLAVSALLLSLGFQAEVLAALAQG